jgi:DNA-binding CsgD family transcriptional regulator
VLSEHELNSVYGLTASEILLTLRLFAGETLREAAQTLGISYETARTKLKSIFYKTGTGRQAQLILLLARHAAPRRRSARGGARRRRAARVLGSRAKSRVAESPAG